MSVCSLPHVEAETVRSEVQRRKSRTDYMHTHVIKDSGLLGPDDASQAQWFPTFRKTFNR